MKNDREICDTAKTLRMYAGFYSDQDGSRHCSNVSWYLGQLTARGIDEGLLEYLALDCPDWVLKEIAALPGRKSLIVHYAKSIICPRYFAADE